MEKAKRYRDVAFDSKAISAAEQKVRTLASKKISYGSLTVYARDATWSFDTLEEFLAAVDQGSPYFVVGSYEDKLNLTMSDERVAVRAPTREKIEAMFAVIDENAERCRVEPAKPVPVASKIFIGHGGDPQWRDLKDHLHEKHGYPVEAYEIGSREGHTIRDILEDMLEDSSFALLVMTGEDKTSDGSLRARQNVIHEAGLFQGRLGFARAIILLEEGTEEFSNIHGLQQIRFAKGRIRESFGDVLAVLKRELG